MMQNKTQKIKVTESDLTPMFISIVVFNLPESPLMLCQDDEAVGGTGDTFISWCWAFWLSDELLNASVCIDIPECARVGDDAGDV